MPLRDHFRPPISILRCGESFELIWAVEINRQLNRYLLPPNCLTHLRCCLAGRGEPDYEDQQQADMPLFLDADGVALPLPGVWPPPPQTMTALFPGEVELEIRNNFCEPTPLAAMMFVLESNKDNRARRRAFLARCADLLHRGVGLLVVDVVASHPHNLHNELLDFLEYPPGCRFAPDKSLYAASYRPTRRQAGDQMDLWLNPLSVGDPMPIVPLPLRTGLMVPIDLETTYKEVLRSSRL